MGTAAFFESNKFTNYVDNIELFFDFFNLVFHWLSLTQTMIKALVAIVKVPVTEIICIKENLLRKRVEKGMRREIKSDLFSERL